MEIGERIREARNKLGLSQVDLAKRISISKELLYRYESGKIDTIPYPKLIALAKALHVSPGYLMGWEEVQDNGQQTYYTDEETQQIAQEVYENPDLKLVFDACKDLTPEQIQAAAALLKTFKGDNERETS